MTDQDTGHILWAMYSDTEPYGIQLEAVAEDEDSALGEIRYLMSRGIRRPWWVKYSGETRDAAWANFAAGEEYRRELSFE